MAPRIDPSLSKRLKVLFIGGLGRSGSTLLARLLGEQAGFVTVGELGLLWHNGLSQNRLCGCGTPLQQCPRWEEVGRAAFGGFDRIPTTTLQLLQRVWFSRRRLAAYVLLPLRLRAADQAQLDIYQVHVAQVLAGIRSVTGCHVIVDASKTPVHLAALLAMPQIDVHVVHLVRDSRAVAHSWQQRRLRSDGAAPDDYIEAVPAWQTAILWAVINVVLRRLRRQAASAQVVRYEDLSAMPATVVANIVRQIGEPIARDNREQQTWDLPVQHSVAGNAIRLQSGPTLVRTDDAWVTRLPRFRWWVVTACTWPWLRAYQYPLRRAARGAA